METKELKRIMHKIAIEYPIVTLLLVVAMLLAIYQMSIRNTVNMYIEFTENEIANIDGNYSVTVTCSKEYYEGVLEHNKVFWYCDLESAIHDGTIEDMYIEGSECFIVVGLDKADVSEEKGNEIFVKVCYDEESIFSHLIDK